MADLADGQRLDDVLAPLYASIHFLEECAGKDADLAIWTGHPFSTYSRVETTLVDGEILFDRQHDLAMRKEVAKEKADRLNREADDEAKNKKSGKPGKSDDETKPEVTVEN